MAGAETRLKWVGRRSDLRRMPLRVAALLFLVVVPVPSGALHIQELLGMPGGAALGPVAVHQDGTIFALADYGQGWRIDLHGGTPEHFWTFTETGLGGDIRDAAVAHDLLYVGGSPPWGVVSIAPDGEVEAVIGPGGDPLPGVANFEPQQDGTLLVASLPVLLVHPDGTTEEISTAEATTMARAPDGGLYFDGYRGVYHEPPDPPPLTLPVRVLDDTGNGTGLPLGTIRDLAVDSAGNLYVANGHRVTRLAPDGAVDEAIGGRGDGDGEPMNRPAALAATPDGAVLVAATDSDNVLRIDPDGSRSVVLSEAARILQPTSLAVGPAGEVYVGTGSAVYEADGAGGSVQIFTAADLGFFGVATIAVGPSGAVFVADRTGRVARRAPGGAFEIIHSENPGLLDEPSAMVVDGDGVVYVASPFGAGVLGAGTVVRLAPGLAPEVVIGPEGDGLGHGLAGDVGLAVAPDGAVYASGDRSGHLFRIEPDGSFQHVPTQPELYRPRGVGVDALGRVYVADGSIVRLTPQGDLEPLVDPVALGFATGVETLAVSPGGIAYGADWRTDLVVRYHPEEGPEVAMTLEGVGSGHRLDTATRLAIAADDTLYVAGRDSDNVLRLTTDGHVSQVIGPEGDGVHPLDRVSGLAVAPDGAVVVSGAHSRTVFRVDLSGACVDGRDNDGDGLVDYGGDPGCVGPYGVTEDPACDDGIDNDGDGRVDWDGGPGGKVPDPYCVGRPWMVSEVQHACGLGAELGVLVPLARVLRGRRRAARARVMPGDPDRIVAHSPGHGSSRSETADSLASRG